VGRAATGDDQKRERQTRDAAHDRHAVRCYRS
jgi:hypothetical protein